MKSFQQKLDYTCGCSVVQTLLALYGLKVPGEKALALELKANDEHGTEPAALIGALSVRGFECEQKAPCTMAELRDRLKHGWHPIIDWVDWGGHWAIVRSYSKMKGWSGGRYQLADPAAKYEGRESGFTEVAGDRLESMWFNADGGEEALAIFVRREK